MIKINTKKILFLVLFVTIFSSIIYGSIIFIRYASNMERIKQELLQEIDNRKLTESQQKLVDIEKEKKDNDKTIKELLNEIKQLEERSNKLKNRQDNLDIEAKELLDYKNFTTEDSIEAKIDFATDTNVGHGYSIIRTDWELEDPRQAYINYVYENLGYDAVLTFTGENTYWTIDRPSTATGKDGNRAYGICQLYYTRHYNFINSEDFKDPFKQLDYCIGVWKDAIKKNVLASTFQAYPTRTRYSYLFEII